MKLLLLPAAAATAAGSPPSSSLAKGESYLRTYLRPPPPPRARFHGVRDASGRLIIWGVILTLALLALGRRAMASCKPATTTTQNNLLSISIKILQTPE
jgi:hypothetical protein